MKRLKLSLIAAAFTLAVTTATLGGDIQTTVTAPAPPQPSQPSAAGDIHCGVASTNEATSASAPVDAITESALLLLQSALTLF